jgi:hypothetical protein
MLVVLGLNHDIWSRLASRERQLFHMASGFFLVCCVLCLIAGARFMTQLSDSYTIGIPGGLLVGAILAMVIRVALITLVSKPLIPVVPEAPIDVAAIPIVPVQTWRTQLKRLPDFSVVFRFLILSLLALTVAFPLCSLIAYSESDRISDDRRAKVYAEFQANHPNMTAEQQLILRENLQNEHFPIHVYRTLAEQGVGRFMAVSICVCWLVPFFLLLYLRSASEFQYATLNRDQLVQQIATDYAEMLEQSVHMQRNKFGLHDAIQPNGAWNDAPFNTRKKQLTDSYAFIDQASFTEYMKSLQAERWQKS